MNVDCMGHVKRARKRRGRGMWRRGRMSREEDIDVAVKIVKRDDDAAAVTIARKGSRKKGDEGRRGEGKWGYERA